MIEALKSDEMVKRAGGRFKLCAGSSGGSGRSWTGARWWSAPRSDRLVIEEIRQGKITLEFVAPSEMSDAAETEEALL